MIAGSSVGALKGAFLAADPSPQRADQLATLWRRMPGRRVFPGSRMGVAARVLGRTISLYSNEGLRRLLIEQLPYRVLEEASVPLIVVATDLGTGRERRLHTGPVAEAVLASAAIPGIYPPVGRDGALLVDGRARPASRAASANVTSAVSVQPPSRVANVISWRSGTRSISDAAVNRPVDWEIEPSGLAMALTPVVAATTTALPCSTARRRAIASC